MVTRGTQNSRKGLQRMGDGGERGETVVSHYFLECSPRDSKCAFCFMDSNQISGQIHTIYLQLHIRFIIGIGRMRGVDLFTPEVVIFKGNRELVVGKSVCGISSPSVYLPFILKVGHKTGPCDSKDHGPPLLGAKLDSSRSQTFRRQTAIFSGGRFIAIGDSSRR